MSNMLEEAKRAGYRVFGNLPIHTMDVRHVFAHEIAHQYWGIVVKMPSPQDQWITESFADYCAALFERDFKGKSYYEKHVSTWLDKAERSAGKAPIPLANEVAEMDAVDRFYTRTNLLYAKGPVLLYALHQNLGEQVFLTWLKSIQTNFRWKFATTRQLFDLLGFITKRDFMPFYEDYFWGTPLPPKKF
jgi:aminopeptidase N